MATPENRQELEAQVAELRARIEEVDDWAAGVHRVLIDLLPLLLRGHPEVETAQQLLRLSDQRYEELLADPASSTGPGDTAELHEPGKMLYRLFGVLGVWPGVDPQGAARESIDRARKAEPWQPRE
ncbi:hypothetical protein D9M71_116250 [compost metagenome]